jgi:cytochrome c oxidase subunit 2
MRHLAVVEPAAEFEAWVARQKTPAPAPADGSPAAAGLRVFQLGACVGCHAVNGVSEGATGPSLSGFASRRTIAGGILPNTPASLARWLRNPPEVKPGSLMPNQNLSEPDVQALVAYLGTLR